MVRRDPVAGRRGLKCVVREAWRRYVMVTRAEGGCALRCAMALTPLREGSPDRHDAFRLFCAPLVCLQVSTGVWLRVFRCF